MRRIALLTLLLSVAAAARAGEPRLIDLSGQTFKAEKAGPLVLLHCGDDSWEGCGAFESLALQFEPEWDKLLAQAKKAGKAQGVYVDQFGGLWRFALAKTGVAVAPNFPGYKVSGSGSAAQVDVLANARQWQDAKRELGLDGPKKKGLAALFE